MCLSINMMVCKLDGNTALGLCSGFCFFLAFWTDSQQNLPSLCLLYYLIEVYCTERQL
jgi:hypothetical protein